MTGDDGLKSNYLIQYCLNWENPSDERISQLHVLMNRLFQCHSNCRSKSISITNSLVVPIAPRVRLMREHVQYQSFQKIYERDCDKRNTSYMTSAIAMHNISTLEQTGPQYKKQKHNEKHNEKNNKEGRHHLIGMSNVEQRKIRLKEYERISNTMNNSATLTEYLIEKLPNASSLWCVRKEMTKQYAISSILSYCFYIEQRDLNKYIMRIDTGDVMSLQWRSMYHRETGKLISTDHVPFRLTPSLQHLMTPIGIHGMLAETMMSTASCLHSNLSFIEDYASLFYQGDMLPWYNNKKKLKKEETFQAKNSSSSATAAAAAAAAAAALPVIHIAQIIDSNVDQVLQRIREIAPLDSAPDHDRTSCMSTNVPSSNGSNCINQAIHELIQIASNPINLSKQEPLWAPYF